MRRLNSENNMDADSPSPAVMKPSRGVTTTVSRAPRVRGKSATTEETKWGDDNSDNDSSSSDGHGSAESIAANSSQVTVSSSAAGGIKTLRKIDPIRSYMGYNTKTPFSMTKNEQDGIAKLFAPNGPLTGLVTGGVHTMTLFVGVRQACNEAGVPWYCRFLTDKSLLLHRSTKPLWVTQTLLDSYLQCLWSRQLWTMLLPKGLFGAQEEEMVFNVVDSVLQRSWIGICSLAKLQV